MMAKWIRREEISLGRTFRSIDMILEIFQWNFPFIQLKSFLWFYSLFYLFFNVLSPQKKSFPFVIFINWRFVYFLFVQFFMRWSLRTKLFRFKLENKRWEIFNIFARIFHHQWQDIQEKNEKYWFINEKKTIKYCESPFNLWIFIHLIFRRWVYMAT